MTYELALISVVIGAGYWGFYFVRHQPHGTPTFGLMQLAAAALAGLGLVGRRVEEPWLGGAGAIGVGAGACLLVIGPVIRGLARRLVAADRAGVAHRLLDLVELLNPGSGVAEEKALVRAMTEIREGKIEPTVDALTAARHRAPDEARLAIDERIAMLYLAAYRWTEAIAHAEAHLFGAPPPREDEGSLRRALGIAPPVWVELLGAYGRVGDLERSARMLARLEDVCAGRDDAAVWIHRARVMFLALAGRTAAVRALLAPRRAGHMSAAARTYWIGVAHEHHGDRAEALAAYTRARARSRGRPRELIDQALAQLAEPRRAELTPAALEVVARVEAAPPPAAIRRSRPRRPRATWLLTASVLAVSAVTAAVLGDTSDVGVLVRAGARVSGLVDAGQWWRIVSCVFVHLGPMHLLLNALALLILGRIAEDLFGGARVVAIFGVAGVAGALASYLASPGGVSAGASGAVFGLLGAVFLEITLHRERHRAAWKRGMWGGLAVVAVGQLGYGFVYPMIDQWAHVGGLAAGALLGLVLSPHARWVRPGTYLAGVLAGGFGALAVTSGVLVARTSMADSLRGDGTAVRRVVDGVAIDAPRGWQASAEGLFQPDAIVTVTLKQQATTSPAQQIALWIATEGRRSKEELGELTASAAPLIARPDGWEGSELVAAPEDAMGYRQPMRVIVCGRAFGDTIVFAAITVPETIARAAPGFFSQLLASIAPVAPVAPGK